MKIEVEDLMVGDWVYIKEYPTIAQPMQVKKEHFVRSLVEFEPIPITPEILEKNGFYDRSEGSKFNYVILTNEYQISYYPKVNRFSIYKKGIDPFYDKDKFFCGFKNIVKYVHELQHALKQCRIEKKIVL